MNKIWQQTLGAIALLSLGIPLMPSHAQASTERDNPILVAQLGAISYCRRVDANNSLNLRDEPSLNSQVIDVLPNNSTVTIDESVSLVNMGKWVRLSEPTQGYVSTEYLMAERPFLCSEQPDRCIQVAANNGLNVRERPTTQSKVITTLTDSQTVNVSETLDASYWVEIDRPVNGFVNSKYLGGGPHYMGPCEE